MSPVSRERIAGLLNAAKFASDVPSKLHSLRRLKDELSGADAAMLSEFFPTLLDLVSDRFSPVRKLTTEYVSTTRCRLLQYNTCNSGLSSIVQLYITGCAFFLLFV